MSKNFREEIHSALANPVLQEALDANAQRRIAAREGALASLPEDWHILRGRAHELRARVMVSLGEHLAERVGFEPTVPFSTTVFETARFNHSRTSPGHGRRSLLSL